MTRFPFILGLVGAVLGLVFGSTSTADYASHLDRRLHDLHCSFVPGAAVTDSAEACRAAMYSPYSALLKDTYWGGIPISLFAVGAFSFFLAFGMYLALAGARAPRRSVVFFAITAATPMLVSIVMLVISATKVGSFCKTCVGIYISSFVLAVGGLLGLVTPKRAGGSPGANPPLDAPSGTTSGSGGLALAMSAAWLAVLGGATLVPAVVYASALPDHRPYLTGCGTLPKPEDAESVLLKISTSRSVQKATLFEDPLCPTCKAFHDRLVAEDLYDKLDVTLVMLPLDSECNWMLGEPLHPGACIVARAVLCGGARALSVLEWAYAEQEALTKAGKQGEATLKEAVEAKWGDDLAKCVDDKKTAKTLEQHLHYAVDNAVPVSTPQMFLGTERVCEEDTDIGLVYTLSQLAPQVVKP